VCGCGCPHLCQYCAATQTLSGRVWPISCFSVLASQESGWLFHMFAAVLPAALPGVLALLCGMVAQTVSLWCNPRLCRCTEIRLLRSALVLPRFSGLTGRSFTGTWLCSGRVMMTHPHVLPAWPFQQHCLRCVSCPASFTRVPCCVGCPQSSRGSRLVCCQTACSFCLQDKHEMVHLGGLQHVGQPDGLSV
jgi:hypothetical protein